MTFLWKGDAYPPMLRNFSCFSFLQFSICGSVVTPPCALPVLDSRCGEKTNARPQPETAKNCCHGLRSKKTGKMTINTS